MLVIAETPANPQLSLADLDELGSITGPFTVVDSTFATPAVQQPLRHGVDLVLHSATKGISGHNDATLGVVAGEKDLIDDLWRYSVLHGATASPYDAHNALRGIRTLPVRVERQSATALVLAETARRPPGRVLRELPRAPFAPAGLARPAPDAPRRQACSASSWPAGWRPVGASSSRWSWPTWRRRSAAPRRS